MINQGVTDGPNSTLLLTGWDSQKQLNKLRFANIPSRSAETLLWSVVKITKKKGFRYLSKNPLTKYNMNEFCVFTLAQISSSRRWNN